MSLDQKDLELIERVIYKNGDDVAVSMARSFERLEERIDAAESRLYSRIAELEDKVEASRQDISDELGSIKADVRELLSSDEELVGEK
jgi:predicted  nucleic acid-binding Zn-ribbon protein